MEGIKDTIFKFLRLDHFVENLTGYLETQVKLVKMEVRDEVAKVLAKGLVLITVILFASLFLLFFSVGLAHYLNSFFLDAFIGYWIVAGIYFVPCLVFLLFRKSISTAFEKYFAKNIKHKD
jgi:uncharacterized membrane protein YqjE